MSNERPVTMKLAPAEWIKFVLAVVAQLVGVVLYVQNIDHKADTALDRSNETRIEFREYRDKTENKLDRLVNDVAEIKAAVKQTH